MSTPVVVVHRVPHRHPVDVHHDRRPVHRNPVRLRRQHPPEVHVPTPRNRRPLPGRVDRPKRHRRRRVRRRDRPSPRAASDARPRRTRTRTTDTSRFPRFGSMFVRMLNPHPARYPNGTPRIRRLHVRPLPQLTTVATPCTQARSPLHRLRYPPGPARSPPSAPQCRPAPTPSPATAPTPPDVPSAGVSTYPNGTAVAPAEYTFNVTATVCGALLAPGALTVTLPLSVEGAE